MRILFVITDIVTGTGFFCMTLGGALRRLYGEEFQVSLLLLRHQELDEAQRANFDNIHFVGTPVHADWRRIYETPRDILRLRRKVRELQPDMIFTIATYSNLLVSFCAAPERVIMSEHMNMSHRTRQARFGWIMRLLMRWRYGRSLIVAAARGITRDLEENFAARRTVVIPNGLDAQRIRDLAERSIAPPPTGERYFIAVGRLTPQKDYATLLRAFALVRQKGVRQQLLILGDGECRADLEKLRDELQIEDAVHFLGHQPNPYPFIKQASALVLSSIFEGFAYVPLEAMALGIPCICTDCPSGPADILGDGEFGLLVPPANPEALAEAMLKLATDPAAHAQFAERARIRSEQLSVEAMARAYRDLFVQEYERSVRKED
jgi:glycosyltransferase involved in cell wall biosynthesis